MSSPVKIELLDQFNRVPVGEWIALRFVVTRPQDQLGAVCLPAGGLACSSAALKTDFFSQDVVLKPGESISLTIHILFKLTGSFDTSHVRVQVNPIGGLEKDNVIVTLPPHPFRVVPSLDQAVSITLTRVCGYDDAVKVEVVVVNKTAAADLTDVELSVGPIGVVLAGPLRRIEPRLLAQSETKFDLVVVGEMVELTLAATIAGERVESKQTLTVPTAEQALEIAATFLPFVFLEPRALTTDQITLVGEGDSAKLPARDGVYRIHGGQSRYVLTVFPSNPEATNVRLYPARGQVEVETLERAGRAWQFLLTVVDNPIFTQLVRLDYDVQVSGSPLRGELYLSVQPSSWKLWSIAITAGLALTLKGVAGLGPALLRPEGGFEGLFASFGDLVEQRWYDGIQATSIFIIRGLLGMVNYLKDRFTE